jgi:hypothetical protein
MAKEIEGKIYQALGIERAGAGPKAVAEASKPEADEGDKPAVEAPQPQKKAA